jgi:hypothetical protein
MATISATWADPHLKNYGERTERLGKKFPKVVPRIINQVGNRAKTQVIRNLTSQTGLPRRTIVKAVGSPNPARPGKLSYEMVTRGGFIRLKYLNPRETRKGVVAKPFGQRTLFAGTFMQGGRFPSRKIVPKFNGHVYRRLNKRGTRITQVRSQVRIPTEMTTGATARAFVTLAAPLLKQRLDAALAKLMP